VGGDIITLLEGTKRSFVGGREAQRKAEVVFGEKFYHSLLGGANKSKRRGSKKLLGLSGGEEFDGGDR